MGIYLERGQILFHQLRYDLAEKELLRELAQEPDSGTAHALLGLCRGGLLRQAEGLESCREAVRLAPDNPYAYYALAYTLDSLDRLDEAAAAIGESLRIDPAHPIYHAQLALIRARQRRFEDSLAAAEAGLRLDAAHVPCLNGRAMALANLRRPAEAEQTFRQALALDPENALTRNNLSWLLLQREQFAEALEHLGESLRLNPNDDWARGNLSPAAAPLLDGGQVDQIVPGLPGAWPRDPQLEDLRGRVIEALYGRASLGAILSLRALWAVSCLFAWGPSLEAGLLIRLGILWGLQALAWPRRFVLMVPLRLSFQGTRLLPGLRLSSRERAQACGVFLLLGGAQVAALVAGLGGSWLARTAAILLQSFVLPMSFFLVLPSKGERRDWLRGLMVLIGAFGLFLSIDDALGPSATDGHRVNMLGGLLGPILQWVGGTSDLWGAFFVLGVGLTEPLFRSADPARRKPKK